VNDTDRKKIEQVIQLLEGFKLETKGIRRHVSTVADLTEDTLKDILKTVQDILNEKRKGKTWPGDSR
jgi:hypothetical protein